MGLGHGLGLVGIFSEFPLWISSNRMNKRAISPRGIAYYNRLAPHRFCANREGGGGGGYGCEKGRRPTGEIPPYSAGRQIRRTIPVTEDARRRLRIRIGLVGIHRFPKTWLAPQKPRRRGRAHILGHAKGIQSSGWFEG